MEVKAPLNYSDHPRPWVFLSGSIEMGAAEDWQQVVVKSLPTHNTILNPRRDDWSSSWVTEISNPQFYEQVEWELNAMDAANLILMYFSPTTKAPITLLELGLMAASKPDRLIVCCPSGFWKKGNVDIVCRRSKILRAKSLDDLISEARWRLANTYLDIAST